MVIRVPPSSGPLVGWICEWRGVETVSELFVSFELELELDVLRLFAMAAEAIS